MSHDGAAAKSPGYGPQRGAGNGAISHDGAAAESPGQARHPSEA